MDGRTERSGAFAPLPRCLHFSLGFCYTLSEGMGQRGLLACCFRACLWAGPPARDGDFAPSFQHLPGDPAYDAARSLADGGLGRPETSFYSTRST